MAEYIHPTVRKNSLKAYYDAIEAMQKELQDLREEKNLLGEKKEQIVQSISDLERALKTKQEEKTIVSAYIEQKNTEKETMHQSIKELVKEGDHTKQKISLEITHKTQECEELEKKNKKLLEQLQEKYDIITLKKNELLELNKELVEAKNAVYSLKQKQVEENMVLTRIKEAQEDHTTQHKEADALRKKETEELQRLRVELYTLREDLGVIRERYKAFSDKNNIPFNA